MLLVASKEITTVRHRHTASRSVHIPTDYPYVDPYPRSIMSLWWWPTVGIPGQAEPPHPPPLRFITTAIYLHSSVLQQCANGMSFVRTRADRRDAGPLRINSTVDVIDRVTSAQPICLMTRRQWPLTTFAFSCLLCLYVLPSNSPASSPYRYISHGIIHVYR